MLLGRKTTIKQTSKVISGQVLICDSVHSWPLGEQAASTMTWYPTQSHYHDPEPCPIIIVWLGSDKYTFSSHWFNSTGNRQGLCSTRYPTQSHYHDTEIFPIISVWLGSDKYKFSSHWFNSTGNRQGLRSTRYPTQSHYHDTEPTSSCPIISVWLGSGKY